MPSALLREGAQVGIGFRGSSCPEQGGLRPGAGLQPPRATWLPHGGAGGVPQAPARGAGAPRVLGTSWGGLEAPWLCRLRRGRGRRCLGRCQPKPGLAWGRNSPFVPAWGLGRGCRLGFPLGHAPRSEMGWGEAGLMPC